MLWGGVICGIIFLYFFRGLLIYTVSDFIAFAFCLVSVILLHTTITNKEINVKKVIEGFALGLCLYGAYNIRTIYLFLMIACLCVLIMWKWYEKKHVDLMITLSACLAGIFICAIPQMVINYNLNGYYSWQVPTNGLMSLQIQWGISCQFCVGYIGDPAEYGNAMVSFTDSIGQAILDEAQIGDFGKGFVFIKEFVNLVLQYPLDIAGIYMRHLLNILYPVYPEQYIQNITRDKSIYLILAYTIFFIASSNFVSMLKLKSSKWVWFCLILLPCLCILPGAVEIRFFIALYFLIYMYTVLGLKEFCTRVKQSKVKYSIFYFMGFLLYIAYAGMLFSAMADRTTLINNF